ncbi:toll/interleukin-1 receptor domain-containing protein [Ulvibacter antarcticus]|uniref:TIR domain-containing protein n=1 Tax=Ulvibacter antarcticus TaxID=442714 RepID=A0A3L9YVD5_9FLAO|nr:toll/interleukin-1 receptor domain-containing protein [Ulvibacter antarcticus]RMA64284.1 TIR domain-containing protein [Ulvibacter antarcticus]
MSSETIFFSYSRDDSEFVLNLAKNLRKAGAGIWLDQLDIEAGTRWDSSIERALNKSNTLLVILSDTSVVSHNVLDEVSFALEENKKVVPVLLEECDIPFRLRRLQYADFTKDHKTGIATLIRALNLDENVALKLADVAIDDPSEAKKVKQETKKEEKKKQAPKIEKVEEKQPVQPPQNIQQPPKTHYNPPPQRKSSNSVSYLIGGIVLGGIGLLVLVIIGVAYNYDDTKDLPYDPDPYNYVIDDGSDLDPSGSTTLSQHDKDWNTALNTNSLQGYMDFLYIYGKNTSHYKEVYTNIYSFLPNQAYAMYGLNNVERYYDKVLYYLPATLETMPMIDDIISPSFATQLSSDVYYNWNGVSIQPGHRLVVLDVFVDDSNVVWTKVRY